MSEFSSSFGGTPVSGSIRSTPVVSSNVSSNSAGSVASFSTGSSINATVISSQGQSYLLRLHNQAQNSRNPSATSTLNIKTDVPLKQGDEVQLRVVNNNSGSPQLKIAMVNGQAVTKSNTDVISNISSAKSQQNQQGGSSSGNENLSGNLDSKSNNQNRLNTSAQNNAADKLSGVNNNNPGNAKASSDNAYILSLSGKSAEELGNGKANNQALLANTKATANTSYSHLKHLSSGKIAGGGVLPVENSGTANISQLANVTKITLPLTLNAQITNHNAFSHHANIPLGIATNIESQANNFSGILANFPANAGFSANLVQVITNEGVSYGNIANNISQRNGIIIGQIIGIDNAGGVQLQSGQSLITIRNNQLSSFLQTSNQSLYINDILLSGSANGALKSSLNGGWLIVSSDELSMLQQSLRQGAIATQAANQLATQNHMTVASATNSDSSILASQQSSANANIATQANSNVNLPLPLALSSNWSSMAELLTNLQNNNLLSLIFGNNSGGNISPNTGNTQNSMPQFNDNLIILPPSATINNQIISSPVQSSNLLSSNDKLLLALLPNLAGQISHVANSNNISSSLINIIGAERLRRMMSDNKKLILLRGIQAELDGLAEWQSSLREASPSYANQNSWQSYFMPSWNGEEAKLIYMLVKNHSYSYSDYNDSDSGANYENNNQEIRFVLGCSLSKLGAIQLDGLMQGEQQKLLLVIRSEQEILDEDKSNIGEIFMLNNEMTGLEGNVRFEVSKIDDFFWPEKNPHRNNASSGINDNIDNSELPDHPDIKV